MMFGEQRRITDMEIELKFYWRMSSAARGMARLALDKTMNFADVIDELQALEVMTNWETLRTATARTLANIPSLRKLA
jgi:hypothetical protein